MDLKPESESHNRQVNTVTAKMIASAQRDIDILRERGMQLDAISSYDILPVSTLFEGDIPCKPNKCSLIAHLEGYLTVNTINFTGGHLAVILRFMSKVRSFKNLIYFETFEKVIRSVLSAGSTVCSRTSLHVIFDSYLELSTKSGERARRAGGVECVDLNEITAEIRIPKQLDKFWTSPASKTNPQQLARNMASSTPDLAKLDVVLSGSVTDEGIVPAQFLRADGLSAPLSTETSELNSLNCHVEEADDRIMIHCEWKVNCGSKRLLVISNDTDTVARLLRFIPQWREMGLLELWIEFGSGEHRRHIPLHILARKLGDVLCRELVKAHVLAGNDALSKIVKKRAALACDPHTFLSEFGETQELSEQVINQVEEYLVHVWAGTKLKPASLSFDQLRVQYYLRPTRPMPLQSLPPTSSVIRGHIHRAYCVVRNVLCLLQQPHSNLNPPNYGWLIDNQTLLPRKSLNPPPSGAIVLCRCNGKSDGQRCRCKKHGKQCVVFCHKQEELSCENK